MFTFGHSYEILKPDGLIKQSHHTAHLNGQRKHPLIVTQNPRHPLVGVRFKPGGLAAFSRIPVVEFSNLNVEFDILFDVNSLEARLYDNIYNLTAQADCLDIFFSKRLNAPSSHDAARSVALRIEASKGQIQIEQLSREFGYSSRTVNRQFTHIFGYAPKFYGRLVRFHHSLSLLAGQQLNLTATSFHSGYYDQSHFIRDCREFTGTTPHQYIEMMRTQSSGTPYRVRFLQSEPDINAYPVPRHDSKDAGGS
jgi:AraC-like DNA-binding protein